MHTRLLLVDDDSDTLELGKVCLESMGSFDVTTANNGEEALRLADDAQPAAVLLDVMMPGIDGPTTLKRLKENPSTQGIPVILITGRVGPEDLNRYREWGARGVIAKPFQPTHLAGQVRRLIRR